MRNSKVPLDLNGTGTLTPPNSPFVPQLLGFAALGGHIPAPDPSYLPTFCNLTMHDFFARDADLSFLVPAWHLTNFRFDQVMGPVCPRCAPP